MVEPELLDFRDTRDVDRVVTWPTWKVAATVAAVLVIPVSVAVASHALSPAKADESIHEQRSVTPEPPPAAPPEPRFTASCPGGYWTVMSAEATGSGPGYPAPLAAVRAISESSLYVAERQRDRAIVEALRPDETVHGTYEVSRYGSGWHITGGRFCIG